MANGVNTKDEFLITTGSRGQMIKRRNPNYAGTPSPQPKYSGIIPKIKSDVSKAKQSAGEMLDVAKQAGTEILFGTDAANKMQTQKPVVAPTQPVVPAPQFAPNLSEQAFADASQAGIDVAPDITGVGRSGRKFQADRIDAQMAAMQPMSQADVTKNALFSGQGRVQLPGGIDPFAGVIGAPGSGARFTGSSDEALASQGLTRKGASAKDKLMASRQERLRNAKTLEDKARLQAQFDAQDAAERRAGEAVKVGLAQADAQAGKTQADRQSKETQARLENRSEQRQAELKGLEGDPDAQREARERHQTEDFIDANNDGQTTNEEYQQAYSEMQETLKRFASLTPVQQDEAKNTWTYMRALALQKYLMGKAKKEAEETGGGFFSNLFGGK
jgi:hypothetical protein